MTHKTMTKAMLILFCILSAGCAATTKQSVPAASLVPAVGQKAAYLEGVKNMSCHHDGMVDAICYRMKKAARGGFDDAFEVVNGEYVLNINTLMILEDKAMVSEETAHE